MKLDRMARNVSEFLATVDQLKAWHCDLVLVEEAFDTTTPHGRFALTMFAAMVELEASTITERLMSGKQQKASKGGYNGSRCPLGYVYNGAQFEIVEEQAQTVRSIFTLFLHGQSINAIAQAMNAQQTLTARGSQWYASTVRTILDNGAYAGVAQWDGLEAAGIYPAILAKMCMNRLTSAYRPSDQARRRSGRSIAD
jgi:site-specific DNA recombinase